MAAKVITVVNQKGGVGKTATTMNLSGTLAIRGGRVSVIDADPQLGALGWRKFAKEEGFPARVSKMKVNVLGSGDTLVHTIVEELFESNDFIIIDCEPGVQREQTQSALSVSDLAIIPLIPAPGELNSLAGVKVLIEAARLVNESLQAAILPTKVEPRTTIAKQVLQTIAKASYPLFESQLLYRNAYKEAMVLGSTVHVLGKAAEAAIAEVDQFTDEVLALLDAKQFARAAEAVA